MTMTYERLRDDDGLRSEFNSFSLADKREIFKQMAPPADGNYSDQDLQGIQKAIMMKTSQADSQVPLQPGTQTVNDVPMSWGQVGSGAYHNFDDSAIEYGKNLWQSLRHPIETGQQLYGLMAGAVEKAVPGGEDKHAEILENTISFFKERYGGTNFGEVVESIKHTMAADPVGFLSDLSIVISGGGTAGLKVVQGGGKLAKIAGISSAVPEIADVVNTASKINSILQKSQLGDLATLATKGVTRGVAKGIKGFATEERTHRKFNNAMQQALKTDGDIFRNEELAQAAIERGINITEKDMRMMAKNRNKLGVEIERAMKKMATSGDDPLFHRDELVVAFDNVLDDMSGFNLEGVNKPAFARKIEKLKKDFLESSPERFTVEDLSKISQGIKFEPELANKFGAVTNQVNKQKKIIISSLLGDIFPESIRGKGGKFPERFTKKRKKGDFGSPDVKGTIEEFGYEAITKEFGIQKELDELITASIKKQRAAPGSGNKGLIVGGASNVAVGLGAGAVGFGLHGVPGAVGYTVMAYYISKLFDKPHIKIKFAKMLAKERNMRVSAAKRLVDQRITDYMARLQKQAQQAGRIANVQQQAKGGVLPISEGQ